MGRKRQKFYKLVKQIRRGKVTTYGLLAKKMGMKGTRAVGNWLHTNPDAPNIPCHRVVNAQGMLAKNFGNGIRMQQQRLVDERVKVVNYRVDLKKYLWKP